MLLNFWCGKIYNEFRVWSCCMPLCHSATRILRAVQPSFRTCTGPMHLAAHAGVALCKKPRWLGTRGGGRGAIKAGRGCRLALPGVRACLPFEEGILHLWTGGLVAQPLGWG